MGVRVTGNIELPVARLDELRHALREHLRLSLEEPGCQRFELHEHPEVPGRIELDEAYTDKAAFRAHQARSAASDWARASADVARHLTVTGLDE
jgi:quinol monooxygenase YgiN